MPYYYPIVLLIMIASEFREKDESERNENEKEE